MSDFRLIFEVRDETGAVVVQKSEVGFAASVQEMAVESQLEASERVLAAIRAGESPELIRRIPDRDFPGEAITAAAVIVGRFITIKLRDWSRAQERKQS